MRAILATLFVLTVPSLALAQLVPVQCSDPRTCGTCEFVDLINNVIQFIIMVAPILAVMAIMYAGFLWFTSRGNDAQITQGRNIFKNVIIGLVLVLAAYLLINVVMSNMLGTGGGAISWQQIECLYPTADSGGLLAANFDNGGSGSGGLGENFFGTGPGDGSVTDGVRGIAQCEADNTNCSIEQLMALGLTEAQANVMSCIAVTENGGNAVGCSGTGPCGTFQISQANWRTYSSQIPGCTAADFGGNITAAQNNGVCNAQVMVLMVQSGVGYQPWTGAHTGQAPWNPYARTCVNNYSTAGDGTYRGF